MSNRQRRLLDMLAGWSQYVAKCADCCKEHPENHTNVTYEQYEHEVDVVMELYQQVGSKEEFTDDDYQNVMNQIQSLLSEK